MYIYICIYTHIYMYMYMYICIYVYINSAAFGDGEGTRTMFTRSFAAAGWSGDALSQVRSWSHWCGLGAFLWAFIAKSYPNLQKLTFDRGLKGLAWTPATNNPRTAPCSEVFVDSVQGSGFRVQGSGFGVRGSGFRFRRTSSW